MRVLLTGHQGYLGTVMAPVLAAAGHEVVGLDAGLFADCVLGPPPADPPGHRVDLRDVTAEHVAGVRRRDPPGRAVQRPARDRWRRSSPTTSTTTPPYGWPGWPATPECGASCTRRPARSTAPPAATTWSTEDAPLRPVTPYAESKVRVEDDLHALADDDFTPVFLRNATAFGFSPRLRADIVLNNLVGHALLSGEVLVLSDGTPWRPLVHAADIARRLRRRADRAARSGARPGVQHRQRAATTSRSPRSPSRSSRRCPASKVVITGETGADPRSYRVDFSRIRAAMPGFDCEWTVKQGAVELADAYRQHGLTREDFERRFTRLAVLRRGVRRRRRRRHPAVAPMTDGRRGDARAGGAAVPAVPEHHRRRCARHPGDRRRVRPAAGARGADRDAGARLDGAAGVEHPRRLHQPTPPGNRVVDFAASSLHVVGYSVPVSATMPLAELRGHLHTLPDQPDLGAVPHQLLHAENWGFCLRPGDAGRAAGRRVRGAASTPRSPTATSPTPSTWSPGRSPTR